jgi:hypothetical protein
MRFLTPLALLLTFLAVGTFGCQSHHEEGVTSNYHSQWTNVNGDTKTTTDAAQAVLRDMDLRNVTGQSTNVDGSAKAKKADGTDVNVAVRKNEGGNGSQVSVTVGMMGDPTLGAEIAKKIKDRVEGGGMGNTSTNMNNTNR